MIDDFRTFDGGDEIACDLCIAGAGAAGITLARAFAGTKLRVVLLESGGLDWEDEVQDMYVGDVVGLPYYDLDVTRLRYFGGTTNHWGGQSAPMLPIDFERRAWVPHSGWPIGREELEPYYRVAHDLLELGAYTYDASEVQNGAAAPLAFRADGLEHMVWRYSRPVRFARAFRDELESAENLRVLLHANVTEVGLDASGQEVEALQIATLTGKRARVKARVFVLALGGIENPRLLLNSTGVVPTGVGNGRDLVGRFFIEHPLFTSDLLLPDTAWADAYAFFHHSDTQVRVVGIPSRELQAREKILNYGVLFYDGGIREQLAGYRALADIKNSVVRGTFPDKLGTHLWAMLSDLDGLFQGIMGRYSSQVELISQFEQCPNPDSRVTLGEERDALGLRRVELDWRLTELDKHSVRTIYRELGRELGRLDVGRLQLPEWLRSDDPAVWPDNLVGSHHHMGTTRMAATPQEGVVDGDCRVHGVDNLYLAGGSVFATASCCSPTISIVTLALRLAEHLGGRLRTMVQASSTVDADAPRAN